MGLDDITRKAKDLLNSPKAEGVTDKVLDRAADMANKATGRKYADRVDKARAAADERLGGHRSDGTTRPQGEAVPPHEDEPRPGER